MCPEYLCNGVIISEIDWAAIGETLNLISISAMRESIREGMETTLSECEKKLELPVADGATVPTLIKFRRDT
jgi:hypothetical protein